MRDAGRMDGERADVDPAAAHEVAGHVVDDLVTVDVRVVVRGRDGGGGVVVELAGHEAADHVVAGLEREMDRRGLVEVLAGDRLEVGDVEGEGPEVPVPADEVEGMVLVVVGGDPAGLRPR